MTQTFSYRARNLSGGIVAGSLQAENTAAAISLLRARNLFVVKVNQRRQALNIGLDDLFGKRLKVKSLAIFCRQFATLNQAGIPILQCLNILARQTEDLKLRAVLESVTLEIEKGKSLSDAFKGFKECFPEIFGSMIAAGELSGTLDRVMERLAITFEKEQNTRDKIKAAMTYPALIGSFSVLAVVVLLVFVVPIFVGVFKSLGAPLPLPTQILLDISNVMVHYWFIILPLVFVVIPLLFTRALATKKGRTVFDRAILRLPVVGPLVVKTVVARFARTLSILLTSGIPLMQALETMEDVVGNTVAAGDIAKARESIKEGERMSPILARSNFFTPMAVSMISVGEESGALDTILEKLAAFYEAEVEAVIASLSSIIEPVMILMIGMVVGFICISIYLPLFSLPGAISAGSGVPM
ncbi:MAG: type II secretion system F family protein [Thermacetogeniaceae bacterium]|jgi:type IV pilus assembly protein PilC